MDFSNDILHNLPFLVRYRVDLFHGHLNGLVPHQFLYGLKVYLRSGPVSLQRCALCRKSQDLSAFAKMKSVRILKVNNQIKKILGVNLGGTFLSKICQNEQKSAKICKSKFQLLQQLALN